VVTFSHLEEGTAEQAWEESARLGSIPDLAFDPAGYDRLVLVSAHPDDETLAAAGLIQELAARGASIRLVLATLGEASHPASGTHSPERLAKLRRSELEHAMAMLAPHARIQYLGLADGGVAGSEDALRQAILAQCLPEPGRTLLLAPWRGDGHADHAAAGRAGARAAAESGNPFLEYPIWLWHWAGPEHPSVPWAGMRRHRLPPARLAAKESALACHRSQVAALSELPGDEALLSEGMLQHFHRPYEVFIDAAGLMGPAGELAAEWARGEFDAIHRGDAEPWQADASWYEERKRALTLAILPHRRFSSGLELGCSTGVLTRELASRCTTLLGLDVSAEAVKTASARTAGLPGVRIRRMTLPAQWPDGEFDLVVLSELGYYLQPADLHATIRLMTRSLAPGGVLVACHWRHPIEGWPMDGDTVHHLLRQDGHLTATGQYMERDFLLETFAAAQATAAGAP
jgi:LmbE family N-acetylglucosaminyl deacetylase